MADVKHMDIAEFRWLGFLQEVNRLLLHPCGLALEARIIESDWDDAEVAESPWMKAQLDAVATALAPTDPWDEGVTAMAREVCRALWPEGSEQLSGVWDYRDDPEGIVYGDGPSQVKANSAELVERERMRHYQTRVQLFARPERAGGNGPAELADVEPLDWVPERGEW